MPELGTCETQAHDDAALERLAASLVLRIAAGMGPSRQRGPTMMNNSTFEFERLLGKAALALCSDFPRDVQEKLFETAVGADAIVRDHLASHLHDHHPKTAHPAKPTQLA